MWAEMLVALDEHAALLAPGGRVIVQIHPKEYRPAPLFDLALARQREYGSTLLQFYAHAAETAQAAAETAQAVAETVQAAAEMAQPQAEPGGEVTQEDAVSEGATEADVED
jgi:hypothetical protein